MIGVGFLLASLVSVQETGDLVAWPKYLPALVFGVIGVVITRTMRQREARQAAVGGGGPQALAESIARIVENITVLHAEKETADKGGIHIRIDQLFRSDLDTFADSRKSVANLYGLEAYAAVMNEFAAGERYLNRVWSASVDGYVDEVKEYLNRAKYQFEQTEALLRGFMDPASDCN